VPRDAERGKNRGTRRAGPSAEPAGSVQTDHGSRENAGQGRPFSAACHVQADAAPQGDEAERVCRQSREAGGRPLAGHLRAQEPQGLAG